MSQPYLLENYYIANKYKLFLLCILVNDEEHSNVHYWVMSITIQYANTICNIWSCTVHKKHHTT
ncbi:hypothetical protein KSS87_016351 [Heliosperma pusillum]|nr:hypothetical protein KSS87_016351 [Heliosperma pusillum]